MDHHIAAYIDAYMGDALDIGSHGLFKEHEITGTRIVLADITAQGVKPVSYTHLRAHEDGATSRMPSSA